MLSTSRALAWEHSCKIVSRNVRCRRAKPRQQRRPHVVSRVDLSGRWSKDRENSELDAYENMLSLLGLNGIKKVAAVQLISGLEIEQATSPPHFTVRYIVSRVQFLQNVERFAFDQQNEMPRRDGQAGSQTATLTQLSTGIQTVITWGEPNPGLHACCVASMQKHSGARFRVRDTSSVFHVQSLSLRLTPKLSRIPWSLKLRLRLAVELSAASR